MRLVEFVGAEGGEKGHVLYLNVDLVEAVWEPPGCLAGACQLNFLSGAAWRVNGTAATVAVRLAKGAKP